VQLHQEYVKVQTTPNQLIFVSMDDQKKNSAGQITVPGRARQINWY